MVHRCPPKAFSKTVLLGFMSEDKRKGLLGSCRVLRLASQGRFGGFCRFNDLDPLAPPKQTQTLRAPCAWCPTSKTPRSPGQQPAQPGVWSRGSEILGRRAKLWDLRFGVQVLRFKVQGLRFGFLGPCTDSPDLLGQQKPKQQEQQQQQRAWEQFYPI